jgi:hypothetical protein
MEGSNRRHYPGIFLEGLRKTTKNLNWIDRTRLQILIRFLQNTKHNFDLRDRVLLPQSCMMDSQRCKD